MTGGFTGGRRLLVALVALTLLSSACGARWSPQQRAAIRARNTAAAQRVTEARGDTSGDVTADNPTPEDDAVGGTSVTGAAASGSATNRVKGAATKLACGAESTAPGVKSDTITLGSISSLSGIVPGLGASAAGGVRAYVSYRNAKGGVCGRKIALREADDGGDAGQYQSYFREMAPKVFALVGGLTIGDDGSGPLVKAENMPVVVSRTAEGVQGLPSAFELNPPFEKQGMRIGKYEYSYAQGARKVALAYLAVDASRAEAQIQRAQMEASGMKIVEVIELPVTTFSFDSTARQVANSGADYLFFIGEASTNAGMAQAMYDTGYKLKFQDYFAFAYGSNFLQTAGEAGEGTVTWVRELPNEEAATNNELALFAQWMDRAAPGLPKDEFAAESWIAAKVVLDSLEQLDGPISRTAVISQMHSIGTYDAGGMMGPFKFGVQHNGGCFVGLVARNGKWQRLTPTKGFLC